MGKQQTRKTRVEYEIRGLYGDAWEMVTTEDDYQSAKEMARCYRENEPQTRFRIAKVYTLLPEFRPELCETLERINAHHGNGRILLIDPVACQVRIKRQSENAKAYTFTLLDGDRVRFRGIVRRIGYVPTWAR